MKDEHVFYKYANLVIERLKVFAEKYNPEIPQEDQADVVIPYVTAQRAMAAAIVNRRHGYATPENEAGARRAYSEYQSAMRKLSKNGHLTFKEYNAIKRERCQVIKDAVLQAEKEPPSIARFKLLADALSQTIIASLPNKDRVFVCGGWFARGLQLLAERPKSGEKIKSIEDAHFTQEEADSIVDIAANLIVTIRTCENEMLSPGPIQVVRVVSSALSAKTMQEIYAMVEKGGTASDCAPLVRKLIFTSAPNHLWRYNGELFKQLASEYQSRENLSDDKETDDKILIDAFDGPALLETQIGRYAIAHIPGITHDEVRVRSDAYEEEVDLAAENLIPNLLLNIITEDRWDASADSQPKSESAPTAKLPDDVIKIVNGIIASQAATTPKNSAEGGEGANDKRNKAGPKGAHLQVSIRHAMKVYGVKSKTTIHNWDAFLRTGGKSGKEPPAGYYGRNMAIEAFDSSAERGIVSDDD